MGTNPSTELSLGQGITIRPGIRTAGVLAVCFGILGIISGIQGHNTGIGPISSLAFYSGALGVPIISVIFGLFLVFNKKNNDIHRKIVILSAILMGIESVIGLANTGPKTLSTGIILTRISITIGSLLITPTPILMLLWNNYDLKPKISNYRLKLWYISIIIGLICLFGPFYFILDQPSKSKLANNPSISKLNGQDVPQDIAEAVKWYRRAAEEGDANAQTKLGLMYDKGDGVPQDFAEAVKWYRRAAEQGNADAQYNLWGMYLKGKAMPQNFADAVKWCRRAAEQGHATAQWNLGLMYENGQGVPQDLAEAVKWYRRAAEQGNAEAQYNLARMYRNGQGVPQDIAEAMKWCRRAAEEGDATAQFNLGALYANGQGVPEDHAEAAKWYRRAAEQGNATAQFNLGLMYDIGDGVPQDFAEAVKWYRRAAEQGNADAQNNLGRMYRSGIGVPENKVLAYALYNLSAAGNPSKDNGAKGNRDRITEHMSRDELLAGQALTRELAQPGNFGKALDAWLTGRPRQGGLRRRLP